MRFAHCKDLIKSDLAAINNGGILKNLFFNESFSFTFWFRKGKCVKQEGRFLLEPILEEASD